jgi:NADPH-dependent ferric siderophore reductase
MSVAEQRTPGFFGTVGDFLHRKGRRAWPLTVTGVEQITPRLVRVLFEGDDLDELVWRRGQDVVLEIPLDDGSLARRHYTIRDHKGRALAIDFVQHGDSPAGRWVRAAKPGVRIDAVGPRGRTVVNGSADWHLFLGDETSVPAISAMLEGLPRGTRTFAFIEIGREDDKLAIATDADATLEWLSRGGLPAGPNPVLLERLERFSLPGGRGHAYITGETSTVRALRHHLLARGMGKDQIAAEGYWRPGRIGGHDHV